MKRGLYVAVLMLSLCGVSFSQDTLPAEELPHGKRYDYTLSGFKEPQIFPPARTDAEVYRIFIFPTFSHALSIRIEKSGGGYSLVAKYLSGQVGYDWGKLKGEKRRRLTEQEWRKLLSLLEQASFWSLPSKDKESKPNDKGEMTICLDNTSWILEGVKDSKYHIVDRYCPDTGSYKEIGLYMFRLSKLKMKESALH
jgi:hypothetical protein